MRGATTNPSATGAVDAAGFDDADLRVRLATINMVARNAEAARAHFPALLACLSDPMEPVAVDAAYALAGVGEVAVPDLLQILEQDILSSYFLNSAFVSLSITAIVLLVSCLSAYASARLRFPGRGGLSWSTLAP